MDRFEKMLKKEKKKSIEKEFHPMNLDEFNKSTDQSMLDSENGNNIDHDQIIKEIGKWD